MVNTDELLKLKELLDKDVITQEEFDKKKQQILNEDLKDEYNSFENTIETVSNYGKSKKKGKITGIGPGIVLIIIIIAIGASIDSAIKLEDEKQAEKRKTMEQYVTSYDDLDNIVKSCGFSNYNFEYVGEENGIYYFIIRQKNSNVSGGVNIQNGQVISVDYANNILYENGQVVHILSDYIITSDEKIDLVYETQNYINNVLKAPATAKYPFYDEWNVGKEDGVTIVQGYVDSENGFGAMIRSQFQVKYQNGEVISLIFDGKEYMK